MFKRYGDVSSSIKLKVRLPIMDRSDCSNVYRAYNLRIGQGQVCAGGMRAKDSCLGDSGKFSFHFTVSLDCVFCDILEIGGPLMHFDRTSLLWVASGIVSFGVEKCGTVGIPGVYTNTEFYLDWILNTLEK